MKKLSDKLIKILSLGIGLAIGIVLIAKVCFELSYDGFRGFVRLAPNVDPGGLKDAIRKMQETHQDLEALEKEGSSIWYSLIPFATQYRNEKSVRNVVLILLVVAVLLLLVSLMNYLLMAISDVVRRSKEVAIRKVNGAVTFEIIRMFVVDVLKLAVIAALIGVAIAYLISDKWLELFAMRIGLSPLYFIIGAVVVLLVVTVVVVLSSNRVARMNPVKSLRKS